MFLRKSNRISYRQVTTRSKLLAIAVATAVLYATTMVVAQTGSSGSGTSTKGSTTTQQQDATKVKGTTKTSTKGSATTGTSEKQGSHPINKAYSATGGKQEITDVRLAGMVGTWKGTSTIQNQTGPVEATFKPALGGQWLEGHIYGYKDKNKKSEVYHGIVFVKADEEGKDNYLVYAFDNWGEAQSGKGKFEDSTLSFDWEYAGGGGEEAKLTFPSSGRMVYEGKIKASGNEMTIALDLSRSGRGSSRGSSTSGGSR